MIIALIYEQWLINFDVHTWIRSYFTCCSNESNFFIIQQITHMGWVWERLRSTNHWNVWKRKFLTLKGSELQVFEMPPVSMQSFFTGFNTSFTLSLRALDRCVRINVFQLNISSTATLGQIELTGHCREVAIVRRF